MKNLVKVIGIGEVMGRKRPPTLRKLPFRPLKQCSLIKTLVLIMRIIYVIINMDNIRQERPKKGPILKLNKTLR